MFTWPWWHLAGKLSASSPWHEHCLHSWPSHTALMQQRQHKNHESVDSQIQSCSLERLFLWCSVFKHCTSYVWDKTQSSRGQASVVSTCNLLTEYEAGRQIGMTSVNMSVSSGPSVCELVNWSYPASRIQGREVLVLSLPLKSSESAQQSHRVQS